jgi:5-(carboxyamino)imidazole ribonucleotide synthase
MLGVMGGGQLGRMFVHAAQVQGFRVAVLEPDAASPAGAAADVHLCAPYVDAAALQELASTCVAVTTEFENVPADALRRLAAGCPVAPPADAVQVCQHRAREKACFAQAGVPCAPFAVLESAADTQQTDLARLLPGILKTSTMGYDGKGQVSVARLQDLPEAWASLGGVACVLEQRLPLHREMLTDARFVAGGTSIHYLENKLAQR